MVRSPQFGCLSKNGRQRTWIGMLRERRWREARRVGHNAPKPNGGGICLEKIITFALLVCQGNLSNGSSWECGSFPSPPRSNCPHTLTKSPYWLFRIDKAVVFYLFQEKDTDQMMRTQNWAVLYEEVKVIHDNGNEEVEDKKAADEDETGEKEEGEVRSTACGISLVWVWITDSCLG